MSTIYTKTAEGQRELQTREKRLAPRARSLLILIDGRRTDEELAGLVTDFGDNLQPLLEAGLVRAVEPPPLSPAPASAPTRATANDAPQAVEDREALRRDALRAVNDLLGPTGEALALRIERAASGKDLDAALERAVAYIANARGGAAAAQFANRFVKTTTG